MARDWFADAFGAAIADIRSKLIDEAWFGRSAESKRPAGIEFGDWLSGDVSPVARNLDADNFWSREREPTPTPEQDHGIDR